MQNINKAAQYYASMENPPKLAKAWADRGSYFTWHSTVPENAHFGPLDIFTITAGNPANPAILFLHGYPTSSFDFYALFDDLSQDYYVCAFDAPGYGFSSKPQNGYRYQIRDDARLADYWIQEVLKLDTFALFTHDKGDSVGLALLELIQQKQTQSYQITHHFIANGNMYLPLAQLTSFQKQILDPETGPIMSSKLQGSVLAQGLATTTYDTILTQEDIASHASIFDYEEGVRVQHNVIQYLNQRAQFENGWLEALQKSDSPTTLLWGEHDTISPLQVADYVYQTCLKDKPNSAYWRLAKANHYLVHDEPHVVASIVRQALQGGDLEGFSQERVYRV